MTVRTTMHDWLKLKRVISILLCLTLTSEVSSQEGICTRSEVVLKTMLHPVYKTHEVPYLDWCYRYGHYRHQCRKFRVEGNQFNEVESYSELETKQFCCPGYSTQQESPLRCAPVCDFTCLNGKCTGPNFCDCNSGYVKETGTENICDPVCSEECVHGYCSSPEFCKCDLGYDHISQISPSPYVCSPVCSNSCINANCIAPNVCSCLTGFAKTLNKSHQCHPFCSLPCHNSVCSSPDQCTCFEGYKKGSSWNVCDPICSECVNAKCTAPEECTCLNGFKKVANVCEPVCTVGCVNGECVKPDTCSCLPGYKSSSDPFTCVPVCLPDCVNGNCTNPDQCECFPGFEEADGNLCRPYCSNCENGVCTEPEVCSCFWGFENENESNCSHQEDKDLDCTFSKRIVNHGFDKRCFKVDTREFAMNLVNCKILRYLAVLTENGSVLVIHCKRIYNLELSNGILTLQMQCDVELQKVEETYTEDSLTSDELSTTSSPTAESTTTEFTWYSTSDRFTESSEQYTTENIGNELEIDITPNEILLEATHFSTLPLDLNITLKFLPLITNSLMMKNHFDNVTASERDWCLCHKNAENWSICSSIPVEMHLCPCQPRLLNLSMEGSTFFSPLTTLTTLAIILIIALLMVYVLRKSKNFYYLS